MVVGLRCTQCARVIESRKFIEFTIESRSWREWQFIVLQAASEIDWHIAMNLYVYLFIGIYGWICCHQKSGKVVEKMYINCDCVIAP